MDELYNYDAYGRTLSEPSTGVSTSLLYAGEQYDEDLGQYYLRARYLNPDTGRFNRLDPWSGNKFDPLSLHKYAYAHSDPVNGIDPSGLLTLTNLMATVRIIANIARVVLTNVVRAIVRVAAWSVNMVRSAMIRFTSVLGNASRAFLSRLQKGLITIRGSTGGWRVRVFKLAGSPGRPTFRILELKNILRIELHPIRASWPKWVLYPHAHVLTFGSAFAKLHLPIVEIALLAYGIYRLSTEAFSEEEEQKEPEE